MQTHRRPRARFNAICLAILLGSTASAMAGEPVPFEYKLKAVFLLNFAKFVSWPDTAFQNPSAPLCICVIGEDPFGPVIDQAVHGETVRSHALKVLRPVNTRDYQSCHIAFISRSAMDGLGETLYKRLTPSALTVGDHEAFLQHGGMIGFTVEGAKVRFVINTTPLNHANFEVSSKLLNLGRAEQH